MDRRKITSPEMLAKGEQDSFFLVRAASFIFRPVSMLVLRAYLLITRSNHVDARSIDWGWGSVNYNRIALVNLLVSKYRDPSYLEIGCGANVLFDSVPVQKKIGVDPSSGGNVRKTSDAFFESNDIQFDVIFVDGLHTYEQVRRDVINAILSIRTGGWIALHDMLPSNWAEQHIPIVSIRSWTGDVWKVAFELSQTPGLEFKIIKIDQGVGVIKVIDKNAVLADLGPMLRIKEFSYFYENISRLPIVEWNDAQEWLRN